MTAPRTAGTQLRAGGEKKNSSAQREVARFAQATFWWKVVKFLKFGGKRTEF